MINLAFNGVGNALLPNVTSHPVHSDEALSVVGIHCAGKHLFRHSVMWHSVPAAALRSYEKVRIL